MNKLIPGAYFSVRDAREQRLRAQIRDGQSGVISEPYDCVNYSDWSRVAEAFREYDPDGSKLAELFLKAK